GNLSFENGHRYGYQLTFFRIGVEYKPSNPSRWAVRDLFMTHLAVTDIDGQHYYCDQRINRAGVGWAGAATNTYHVWNENWQVSLNDNGNHLLRADENGIGVALDLEPGKPPVQNGAEGVSQKGDQAGNGSHYYSLTRMPTRGSLLVSGEHIPVSGLSWMDHEFGTTFLEPQQKGWDWFSIQLDDGTDLMLFQLRRDDGSRDKHSGGTFIEKDGRYSQIMGSDFQLDHAAEWKSPASGASYPLEWHISLPAKNLDLNIKAAVANQEMRAEQSTGVTYWEGAVEISGTHNGKTVSGRGYLEMTGYANQSMGNILR
ncbi:MAG TPA: lipocalin family protein, partial [Blastocatellia bacterium]|nr:lipocalin family protein [Blastocatellia bacterium]